MNIWQNPNCNCALCRTIREKDLRVSGGWCDPRRGYHEAEEAFLQRVPDGFLSWPEDHVTSLGFDLTIRVLGE